MSFTAFAQTHPYIFAAVIAAIIIIIAVLAHKSDISTYEIRYLNQERNLKKDLEQEQQKFYQKAYAEIESKKRAAAQALQVQQEESIAAIQAESMSLRNRYIEVKCFKQLHYYLAKNSFLFQKTAIDDTLFSDKKYQRTLTENLELVSKPVVSVKMKGSTGKVYTVTLNFCTCIDFQTRKEPCKHMIRLAEEIGLLTTTEHPKEKLLHLEKQLNGYYVARCESFYKEYQQKYEDITRIIYEKSSRYPWMAQVFADYQEIADKEIAHALRTKVNPAIKAAKKVTEIAAEKKALQKQVKMYEYQLRYLEAIFPWLEEFKEIDPTEAYDELHGLNDSAANEYETLKKWLSPEEYSKLSSAEKYQLALDRYKSSSKTNWQIGIEYERYVGYVYEQQGYRVTYQGALQGLEDMGRDLIVQRDSDILVIQCKRWAKEKIIHEKHIFQLYGTMVLLKTENPSATINGLFVTTTVLSDTAKKCADLLQITYNENFSMNEYPLIKCNVSKTNEKIYHLPFDQQYDKVVIEPKRGECYAATVKEAEKLGFRRAFKWSGK